MQRRRMEGTGRRDVQDLYKEAAEEEYKLCSSTLRSLDCCWAKDSGFRFVSFIRVIL